MKWIVFFDGSCGLCSRSVRFLASMDRRERLLFASLQGETAASLQLAEHASVDQGTMVVKRESDGRIFLRSDGVLEVCRALGGIWHVAVILRAIPHVLRDALYRLIARNRIRWFGHADACSLPSPSLASRLLP
jgi:predicted DCC family thiol-disulfide oxidoreductase YuxK